MSLDLTSDGGDSEATRKREEADRLFIAQQQNQAKLRELLHAHIEARQHLPLVDQETSLRLLTSPLIGQVHEGSWAELWPFMQDMITLGATVGLDPYIVVLGGWLDSADASTATLPTPPELFEELKSYGVPGDILRRINAHPTPADLENIWFMVRNNADLFSAAVENGMYSIARVRKVALEQMAQRLLPLQGRFLYLEHRRFWFFPTAADPLLGWADFMAFAVCYHQLPPAFKAQMGPYRLTIVPAVIPAAAPAPTP
jgi:hypothetical protein